MTKFFHLGRTAAKPKKTLLRRSGLRQLNLKHVNTTLTVMTILFGVGYLVLMNGLATKGYQIKDLEQHIAVLQDENSDLKVQTLSLQSLDSVKQKVDKLGLVAVTNVEYLSPTPVALAR